MFSVIALAHRDNKGKAVFKCRTSSNVNIFLTLAQINERTSKEAEAKKERKMVWKDPHPEDDSIGMHHDMGE